MNKMDIESQFKENMEKLSRAHERSKVYVDFMDYFIYQHSNSPGVTLPTGYKKEEMNIFQEACKAFEEIMASLINKHGWYDYIGEYYEEYVLASSKASNKGQFYTPRQISDLLSQIVGYKNEENTAYDPACGSARNLCEYHSKHPGVLCVGEDLDESACKMAVINFCCHDVNGVVRWVDALTREYFGVTWRILGGQVYVTDDSWLRAVEDIKDACTILTASDEEIATALGIVAEVISYENEEEDGNKI